MSSQGWEREATNFIAWARTPGHDAYWHYRDSFFELVPAPGRATLEVGAGEGRVSRDLAERGHRVTGLDAAPTLVRAAREAGGGPAFVLGRAETLPFEDGSFDLVVAYNSLMDVDDMPLAVAEIGRVLEPAGRLCFCVAHPLSEAGCFDSRAGDAPFRITGSYFGKRRVGGIFERNGLTITMESWAYPLEAFARALESAGLVIEVLREPLHPGDNERRRRIPNFLIGRAAKAPAARPRGG